MKSEDRKNLLDLIDAVCGDRCDDETLAQLEQRLRDDPDAISEYVRYRSMHAELFWLTAQDGKKDGHVAEDGRQLSGRDSQKLREEAVVTKVSAVGWLRKNLHYAIAASLLLVAVGFISGQYWQAGFRPIANRDPGEDSRQAESDADQLAAERPSDARLSEVARITGLVDCKWTDKEQPIFFGRSIQSGENIEISEGLVQLTFSQGAKVILQGPARFVPESVKQASLEFGKLSAMVPVQARGYTVTTPTAQIVDLGTEFALDVASSGITEVHVLEGDVVARRRLPDGQLRGGAVHARKLDAIRFENDDDEAQWIDAEPDKFARQITPTLTSEELPPLPVTSDLKLWVAADLLVSKDSEGRVSAWRDVCIGDNQIGNDACQFSDDEKPAWISDAGFGKPAIRFNGESTRLFTDAFATGNKVTAFVAFRPSTEGQLKSYWGGHLLNFGGYAPTIELAVRENDIVTSALWAADAVGTGINVGVVKNGKVERGSPQILCYCYNLSSDVAEQWLNGESQGTDPASLSARTNSTRTIGGHGRPDITGAFFKGDIYEVLIYDSALPDDQRELVHNYLEKRHLQN